jgi:integrase
MRDIREQAHGPYRRGNRWRVVETAATGARSTVSFASEAEALAYIAQYNQAATGRKVSDAVEAYLAAASVKPSTAQTLRYRFKALLEHVERDRVLTTITPRVAASMYAARVETAAVDTHRGELAAVRALFAWCVDQGWLRANPFADVKPTGRKNRRSVHLRIDEARRLRDACYAEGSPAAVAVAMALLFGLRAGEVVGLRVRDIDDHGRVIWVADPKTPAGQRHLEAPEEMRPALRALVEGRPATDRVFPLSRHWLVHHTERLCGVAGVPEVSPHALRRTWSALAAEAMPVDVVSRALGHASVAITRRHYQPSGSEQRRAGATTLRVLKGGK